MEHLVGRRWRMSSYSNNGGADCVEVGLSAEAESVPVRDTKDRSGPILLFNPPTWRVFAAQLKADPRNT